MKGIWISHSLIWAATYRSHAWLCCKDLSKLKGDSVAAPSSAETDDEEEETDEFEALLYNKNLLQYPSQPQGKGQYSVNCVN